MKILFPPPGQRAFHATYNNASAVEQENDELNKLMQLIIRE